jgi:hypothetical protein
VYDAQLRALVAEVLACPGAPNVHSAVRSFVCFATCSWRAYCEVLAHARVAALAPHDCLQPERYTRLGMPLPLPPARWHPKHDGKFDAVGRLPPDTVPPPPGRPRLPPAAGGAAPLAAAAANPASASQLPSSRGSAPASAADQLPQAWAKRSAQSAPGR